MRTNSKWKNDVIVHTLNQMEDTESLRPPNYKWQVINPVDVSYVSLLYQCIR